MTATAAAVVAVQALEVGAAALPAALKVAVLFLVRRKTRGAG